MSRNACVVDLDEADGDSMCSRARSEAIPETLPLASTLSCSVLRPLAVLTSDMSSAVIYVT